MKHLASFILIFCVFLCQPAFSEGGRKKDEASEKGINKKACTCNGIPLKGKVKIVNDFADFKVKVVTSFPDIEIKTVNSFPDHCGKWQFVENSPDFTIQFVESFPDIKIKFTEAFPGMK